MRGDYKAAQGNHKSLICRFLLRFFNFDPRFARQRQPYLPWKPLVLRMCIKIERQASKCAFSNSDDFYGKQELALFRLKILGVCLPNKSSRMTTPASTRCRLGVVISNKSSRLPTPASPRYLLGVGILSRSWRFNTPRLWGTSSEYAYRQIISLCLLQPRLAACSE